MFHLLTNLTWLWWIAINAILFGITYQCIIKYWSFFRDRNVKFVRGLPFFGSTYKMLFGFEAANDAYERIYNLYRDESVIGMYEFGGGPLYMIRDPEMIKQIAVKDFDHFVNHRLEVSDEIDPLLGRSMFLLKDQKWKDMRSTLSPAFTGSKMRLMLDLVTECADEFCNFLKSQIGNEPAVYDSKDLFLRFASDTIATSAFGIKINSLKDRDNDFYRTGLALTNFEGTNALKFYGFAGIPKVMKFFKIKFLPDEDAMYLREMVHSNMNYRLNNNLFRPDLINLLMEAKRGVLQHDEMEGIDDDVGFATVQESYVGKSSRRLQKWEDDDFTAQCVLFILAGLNTLSTSNCFMAYELAVNPDIQRKLYQEIHEVCNKLNGSKLTYEVLQQMTYMDCVVSETLRRWTVMSIIDRRVSKPYVINDKNGNKIQLNADDGVAFPSGAIHMDPKYYPNPKKFEPERFNEENKRTIQPSTYFPFGNGPRNCVTEFTYLEILQFSDDLFHKFQIASRFALMEMKCLFFYLLKSFVIEKCSKTQHPLKLKKNTASTGCEKGFWIQLRKR